MDISLLEDPTVIQLLTRLLDILLSLFNFHDPRSKPIRFPEIKSLSTENS